MTRMLKLSAVKTATPKEGGEILNQAETHRKAMTGEMNRMIKLSAVKTATLKKVIKF